MDETQSLPLRSKDEHPAFSRPTRTQLLFEFDMKKEVLSREDSDLGYFLPDPYPPSTRTLQSLTSININDLKPNERRIGCVLYLNTIETALRHTAVRTIVEDNESVAEGLAIYNVDLSLEAYEYLPEDTLIAVKEPMLVVPSSGSYIRVDHPCDLVILSGSESQIPQNLASNQPEEKGSALEWKTTGNTAYANRMYLKAISAYSQGLELCTENDTDLKSVLLRNRASASICLGRFKQGLEDCKAALIESAEGADEEETKASNAKAYQKAAHATYSLGDYDQAESLCKKALELFKDSKEALQIIQNIEKRRQEQDKGDYDFEKMTRLCTDKRNRLDHANYLSNVEVRDAGKHGRGLFTTRGISAGGLIMCEKAMFVSFDSDPVSMKYAIFNTRTKRKATVTQPPLLFSICSKLSLDLDAATKFFNLYDGQTAGSQPEVVDGIVVVDIFKVASILDHNAMGCPTVASTTKKAQTDLYSSEGHLSTGVWEKMSYINHACNGNAMRSFIGDMIIIRATRDIQKDEEIFMPYRMPNIDNKITQGEFYQIWGFKCDCELCDAEMLTTALQRRQRNDVSNKLKGLLANEQKQLRIETLYKKLKTTYDEKSFKNLPKLALFSPGWILCAIHNKAGEWPKLVAAAVKLLQDLEYSVDMDDRIIGIDRKHCLTLYYGHDAAMYAAHGYRKQGKPKIASQFDDFAKSLWLIMYGTLRGFDSRVKELHL